MGDDILVSMTEAVENSNIVLICINQQYYESHYCRLGNIFKIHLIPLFFQKLVYRSRLCSREAH